MTEPLLPREIGPDIRPDNDTDFGPDVAAEVVALLIERGLTVAVAESLTGGLLVAELVAVAGASAAVRGAVVAYHSQLKHSLLGVDAVVLAEHGPVHPQVASQMADRVRGRLSVYGVAADIGISTTGVAGPGPHDGQAAGTVYLGLAIGTQISWRGMQLMGSRSEIRHQAVAHSLDWLKTVLQLR